MKGSFREGMSAVRCWGKRLSESYWIASNLPGFLILGQPPPGLVLLSLAHWD